MTKPMTGTRKEWLVARTSTVIAPTRKSSADSGLMATDRAGAKTGTVANMICSSIVE